MLTAIAPTPDTDRSKSWAPDSRPSRPLAALGLALLATAPGLALAASNGADSLQEIVVTATRRAESISKVPLSITAFSQNSLDTRGIKDFQDIARFVPGVSIDNSGTNAISIRGISSSGGAGTTGIYIDDTPIQMRSIGFNPDDTLPRTFDLQRVEILRGPQGTLFGSGSEGGTVRYIMTPPSLTRDSTYARTELSFTRGGEPNYEAGIAHGGPIVDGKLGYRASIWYRYDGGWINRVDPTTRDVVEKNVNHVNTVAARFALLYQPVDGLRIEPSVMFQDAHRHDVSTYWPAYSDLATGRFNTATPERIPVPDRYYLPALRITADIGKTQLISNTSYYNRHELTGYQGTVYDLALFQSQSWLIGSCGSASTTATPPCSWYPLIDANGLHLPAGFQNYSTPNTMTNDQESWTQEIRWQSNDPQSRWNWTLGAFWSLSRESSVEELKDTQIIPFWNALFGIDPQSYYGTYYYCNGAGVAGQTLPNCDIYYNGVSAHDRQIAGFGQVTYDLTKQWRLTLGGRVAHMSFAMTQHADGLENYGPSYAAANESQTAFTPKASIGFQADPNNLYYATYAKGFRPGGGNPSLPSYCDGTGGLQQTGYPNGSPLTYNADTTQSFEIGSKNAFADRLRLATSIYYVKWNNIQQSVYVAYNCGLQFTDNLGTAVAKGFDLQADLSLGGGFSANAAVGYTSARYTRSTAAPKPLLVLAGDAISGQAAIDGGPGTGAPWTVSLGAEYRFAIASQSAFLRMDWEYQSRNPWLAANQDPRSVQYDPYVFTLSSTTFASIRTGIEFGSWRVSLFVNNLFDSRTTTNYELGQLDSNNPSAPPAQQQNFYTFRPRTIGITATFRK